MPEYRLTPKAKEDMEAVWLYSLSQWGMAQTSRYIDDLVDAFLFLTETPKAGSACDNIREGYRKYPIIRHTIYYKETAYGIEVVRVLHGQMLITRYL